MSFIRWIEHSFRALFTLTEPVSRSTDIFVLSFFLSSFFVFLFSSLFFSFIFYLFGYLFFVVFLLILFIWWWVFFCVFLFFIIVFIWWWVAASLSGCVILPAWMIVIVWHAGCTWPSAGIYDTGRHQLAVLPPTSWCKSRDCSAERAVRQLAFPFASPQKGIIIAPLSCRLVMGSFPLIRWRRLRTNEGPLCWQMFSSWSLEYVRT